MLIARLKTESRHRHFWWSLLFMGQIASDRTALRIFEVFEHLWLAFSDIFGIFAGACFCLALGGKLHITKAVDLGLEF